MKIKNLTKKRCKNKKALSEIVSYVLLIVIALGLAAGVYVWLRNYLPSQNEKEKCSDDVSLELSEYACNSTTKTLTLNIKNSGFFNVSGFFIRASNTTNEKQIFDKNLTCNIKLSCVVANRFDFYIPLKNNQLKTIEFSYSNSIPLKRIQIQPYTLAKKEKGLLMCSPINLNLERCD
jgi:hypothetical protein